MQRISPNPGSPGDQSDPYGFIVDQGASRRKGLGLPGGQKGLLMMALIGAFLVAILGIVYGLFFASKSAAPELVDIAARQTEMIRICDIGISKARSSAVKNTATTTKVTLLSDQERLIARLKSQKQKVAPKDLQTRKNTKIDTMLTQAAQANNFDTAFNKELAKELSEYQTALKQAYDDSQSTKTKELLDGLFTNASTLMPKTTTILLTPRLALLPRY